VWPLLEVVDECADEPWCAPLGRHVERHRGRRHAAARHLAELFASYAAHRPETLGGVAPAARSSSTRGPPTCPGRPQLWRRLRERIGRPGPAERLTAACAVLREEPGRSDLPARLSVFGPTRLPADQLAVLTGLAEHREVHLWLAHPSPRALGRPRRAGAGAPAARGPGADAPRHPCCPRSGRDVRELQVRLAVAAPGRTDRHHRLPDPPPTLLGRLQRELRDDAPPTAPAPLDADDRSVRVHSCHGPDRQVEVLREVVLGPAPRRPHLEAARRAGRCARHRGLRPAGLGAFGLDVGAHGRADDPDARATPASAAGPAGDRALRQVNPAAATPWPVAGAGRGPGDRLPAARPAGLAPGRLRFRLDDRRRRRASPTSVARSGRAVGPGRGRTARRSGSTASPRTPGRPGSTGCCSGW
jgi:exodeoxyribonuclease V gamma subunit